MRKFSGAHPAGYTLVELVIAIAITVILAFAGARYIFSNKVLIQQGESLSLELISFLREARSMAFSGATVETQVGEETVTEVPEGGYGVFFDAESSKAILFADTANLGQYDPGEEIKETTPYYPLLRLVSYRTNFTGTLEDSQPISDNADSTVPYYQRSFWIIFAPTSGAITFGSETAGAITDETKEFFIDVILEGLRHWHININKVSRFLTVETYLMDQPHP